MKPKRPRIPEKSVESAIITRLQLNGWTVHKLDTQSMAGRTVEYDKGGKVSTRKYVDPTAVEGQPDLIAVRSWGREPQYRTMGNILYIECKAMDGKLTKMQEARHGRLRGDGFTVLVPYSESEFVSQMKELGVTLR